MASVWRGNILLKGYFKNTKTYQNMLVQHVVRPFLFHLEEFNQIDS